MQVLRGGAAGLLYHNGTHTFSWFMTTTHCRLFKFFKIPHKNYTDSIIDSWPALRMQSSCRHNLFCGIHTNHFVYTLQIAWQFLLVDNHHSLIGHVLVQNNNKVIETRLKNIYSLIGQYLQTKNYGDGQCSLNWTENPPPIFSHEHFAKEPSHTIMYTPKLATCFFLPLSPRWRRC